jgi:thiamine pyrophosphate-dependent acetolactate synthase large subunit-like protein
LGGEKVKLADYVVDFIVNEGVHHIFELAGGAITQNGRPGPVLLDLLMDVQRVEIDPQNLPGFWESPEFWEAQEALPTCSAAIIDKVIQLITTAERPVILAGGGVRIAGAVAALRELVTHTNGLGCDSA